MFKVLRIPFALALLLSAGCLESTSSPSNDNSGKGIIGKTTQDIRQFDANKQNQVVSDQKIHATDPITAPLSAYGPMMERISSIEITSALNLFHAENERYPKDLDEFMETIVKANNIRLPVLPYKGRYEYNVEKHELMIVRDAEDAKKQ
jgi:hypothetical protein